MADANDDRTNFAIPSDIADVWRPLDEAAKTRAAKLIEQAARAIRRTWPDVDARIANGTLGVLDVADVIVWTVLPVLALSETHSGTPLPFNAKAYQETSGSESVSITLSDGSGGLISLTFLPWMVDVFTVRTPGAARWPSSRASNPPSGYYERSGLFQWPERGTRGAPR